MSANIGTIDRLARFVLGAGLIAATVTGLIGPWGYLGVIPLVTALFRFCPAYTLVGINTCARPNT